jgi:hypothetical protein
MAGPRINLLQMSAGARLAWAGLACAIVWGATLLAVLA